MALQTQKLSQAINANALNVNSVEGESHEVFVIGQYCPRSEDIFVDWFMSELTAYNQFKNDMLSLIDMTSTQTQGFIFKLEVDANLEDEAVTELVEEHFNSFAKQTDFVMKEEVFSFPYSQEAWSVILDANSKSTPKKPSALQLM